MILIDKEHLWSFLKMYQYDQISEEKQNAVLGCIELLKQEKEVEAIPRNWILDWVWKSPTGLSADLTPIFEMLEDWEKENDCI